MPAIASDRAAIPSLASVLPMAETPIRKTTVISSLETTRVAVASIQPRRQRLATSQPPPAPAKTASATMTRTPTLRATITPQYRKAPIAHPRATSAGTPQPRPYIGPHLIDLDHTADRVVDRGVGGFEQAVGQRVDHGDGDGGEGDGGEGEEDAGHGAERRLGEGAFVSAPGCGHELDAERADGQGEADGQQQLVVVAEPPGVEVDGGGLVDGLGGEVGRAGGQLARRLRDPRADAVGDGRRRGWWRSRRRRTPCPSAGSRRLPWVVPPFWGEGQGATDGRTPTRAQGWLGRHWTARVVERLSAPPAAEPFQAIDCLPVTVTA